MKISGSQSNCKNCNRNLSNTRMRLLYWREKIRASWSKTTSWEPSCWSFSMGLTMQTKRTPGWKICAPSRRQGTILVKQKWRSKRRGNRERSATFWCSLKVFYSHTQVQLSAWDCRSPSTVSWTRTGTSSNRKQATIWWTKTNAPWALLRHNWKLRLRPASYLFDCII